MPTILSQEAALYLVDSASTGRPCDFIDRFISDKNADRLFYRGMIFGTGNVILEYFAGAALWHSIKTGRLAVPEQPLARQQLFNEHCNLYKSNGGNLVPARSNSYVAFSKHVSVATTPQVGNHPDHDLSLTFTPRVTEPFQTFQATAEQANFFTKFNQSPYSVSRTPADKVIRGIKKDASGLTPTPPELPQIGNLISVRQFMTRRACKFLLYDVVLDQRGVIHYALDELTPEHILNKTALPLEGRDPVVGNKVPVCTSEVRELFRMWNFFRNHTVFYREFKVVEPMWVTCNAEDKKKWAEYAYHLLSSEAWKTHEQQNAQFKELGAAFAEFFLAFSEADYDAAIQRYHAVDYRLFPKSALKHPSLASGVFVPNSLVIPPPQVAPPEVNTPEQEDLRAFFASLHSGSDS